MNYRCLSMKNKETVKNTVLLILSTIIIFLNINKITLLKQFKYHF